jgi:CARDB
MMLMAAALTAFSSVAAYSQPTFDLSVRQAIYFTGKDTKSLDAAEQAGLYRPQGAYGNTLKLKASQAIKCDETFCSFNLGVLAWRDPGKGSFNKEPFSTYGVFTNTESGVIGNTIIFEYKGDDNAELAVFIMPVKMKPGKNKITFTIDPENKTAETNEKNNSVTAYFDVDPGYTVGEQTTPTTPQTSAPLPDLMIGKMDFSDAGTASITIQNRCKGQSGPTTVRLDIYKTLDPGSGVLRTYNTDVPAIDPNGSVIVKVSTGEGRGEFTKLTLVHYLRATVDPDNKIKEVTKDNNGAYRKGELEVHGFPAKCN